MNGQVPSKLRNVWSQMTAATTIMILSRCDTSRELCRIQRHLRRICQPLRLSDQQGTNLQVAGRLRGGQMPPRASQRAVFQLHEVQRDEVRSEK